MLWVTVVSGAARNSLREGDFIAGRSSWDVVKGSGFRREWYPAYFFKIRVICNCVKSLHYLYTCMFVCIQLRILTGINCNLNYELEHTILCKL